MRLIDTHAHLNFPEFRKDLKEVVERAKSVGLTKIIVVGIDRKTGERAIEIKKLYPEIIEVAIGFHPHEVKKISEEDYLWLESQLPQAVALGEIGLDFVKEYSPKEVQLQHLERLLEIAKKYNRPVILHMRGDQNFWKFALEILSPFKYYPLLFHCFTADKEVAKAILEFNSIISIPGIVTFEKAENLRETVRYVPIERIVLETDCPFLSPNPFRGKRNEPAFIEYTAKMVAELKGMSYEEVCNVTSENAERFFNLV